MAAAHERSTAAPQTGWPLIITRIFGAPRDRVFDAWTEHDHLMQWFCPKDFTVLFGEFDVRPGGAWRSGMRSPDGRQYIAGGVYREVNRPERLVFTHAWEKNDIDPADHETLVTVTLAEHAGKTTMIFEQTGLPSAESRDSHKGGWSEAFDHLAATLDRP